jgi:hypothetical protein
VGDAGAPVDQRESAVLKKAYQQLKPRLRDQAIATVEQTGLIQRDGKGSASLELACVDEGECVFVTYDDQGIAECAIQKAYQSGDFSWPKPISCHLFPLRLKKVGELEYANYEYVPSICSPACERGEQEGIYLSDFLEEPLVRRYGRTWYEEFSLQCEEIRTRDQHVETV